MPNTTAETKANRLLQIEVMLLVHSEGLSQAEIARRLGVNRSTIHRYLPDLPKHIYEDIDGRWRIDRECYLVQVRFSLNEALAVHLAARLLAARMERQNPHAASALRKLGVSLEMLAPRISTHLLQSADLMDDTARRQDPAYLAVLECLTTAWAEQRKVTIWRQHASGDPLEESLLSPYFIEPNAVGQATYVIGLRQPPGALRTLKIERIERAKLTREPYTIPDDFDPCALLQDAWGIWFTEGEPVRVVLQFSPSVAKRVLETRWHRSEQVSKQANGSLIWSAMVAEPAEMLPWIRGWGADCELMEPASLREKLSEETRRLERLYHKL